MRLELSPEELASWREHSVTKLALAWMQDRIVAYRRDIPLFIVKNRIEDARAASGALQGYEEVLAAFMEEAPAAKDEAEEPFVDPAARPSAKETT